MGYLSKLNSKTTPRLLIVAPPRSATGYIASLLTKVGIPTGHEKLFTIKGFVPNACYLGDSSWLAVPFINDIPKNTIIIRQLRNPIKSIESLYKIGFFNRKKPSSFVNFARRNLSQLDDIPQLDKCIEFIYQWNKKLSEKKGRIENTYKIEDIDVGIVKSCVTAITESNSVSDTQLENAINSIPTNYNDKKSEKLATNIKKVDWRSVSLNAINKLKELCEELGYEIPIWLKEI